MKDLLGKSNFPYSYIVLGKSTVKQFLYYLLTVTRVNQAMTKFYLIQEVFILIFVFLIHSTLQLFPYLVVIINLVKRDSSRCPKNEMLQEITNPHICFKRSILDIRDYSNNCNVVHRDYSSLNNFLFIKIVITTGSTLFLLQVHHSLFTSGLLETNITEFMVATKLKA